MSRLFIAVDLPAAVRAQLNAFRGAVPRARFVPEAQLHLTLRFIGDADDAKTAELTASLKTIAQPAFELALAGVGQFPPKRAAHVLWAGVHPVEEVTRLAAQIEAAVTACGIAPEKRPFSPHITIARLKEPAQTEVKRFLEANSALASAPFPVGEFRLYSSVLSSAGADHRVLESFPLSK